MSDKIVPIFIPHYGCPHDCVFCNQRKITNYQDRIDVNQLKNYIDQYLTYFDKKKARRQISFYGGSFTGLPKETMIAYLEIAKTYVDSQKVDSLRCSTRPDYITEDILDLLAQYHVETIELGVQSTDDEVLAANCRAHTVQDVKRACYLIQKKQFELGLQMMIGMYGSNASKDLKTCEMILRLKPDFVRIYPTLVIKSTKLQRLYESGEYQAMTVDEAVDALSRIYVKFLRAKMPVIRIGLQASKELEREVAAGPYHPAIRQLVEETIYRQSVLWKLPKQKIRHLTIFAPKEEINYFIGNRASNKDFFTSYYQLEKIRYQIRAQKIGLKADDQFLTYELFDYLTR